MGGECLILEDNQKFLWIPWFLQNRPGQLMICAFILEKYQIFWNEPLIPAISLVLFLPQ